MALTRALFAGDDPTPDSIKKRMALAELLRQQGGEFAHVDSPLEAVGSILQSGIGAYQQRKAEGDQRAGMATRNGALASLLMGSAGSSSPAPSGGMVSIPGADRGMGGPTANPANPVAARPATNLKPSEREGYAMNYLIGKGLAPHQAAGVVGNLIQESSLNTGARNPGDGADGSDSIGIAQWNGARAAGLKRYAAANGGDAFDINTQLDYILHELDTTEAGAGRALRAANTAEDAAAAFIGYERPQGWTSANPRAGHGWANRSGHALRLAGGEWGNPGGQPTAAPVQVASLDPSAGMGGPQTPAQPSQAPTAAPQPVSPQVAQMLVDGNVGGYQPTQPAVSDAMIAELLGNPWTEDLGQGLLQQRLQDNAANARLMREAQIERAQTLDERAYDARVRQEGYTREDAIRREGYGRQDTQRAEDFQRTDSRNAYLDARQGARDARSDLESDRNFDRQIENDRKPQIIEVFDEETGRSRKGYMDPQGQFVPVGGVQAPSKSNGVVVRGPDGSLVQVGGDMPALTEGQSKDAVFSTRARGALTTLDQYAPALLNRMDRVRDAVPFGFGREGQNTDYQLARQAGNEFLQAILRKDTGAAITGEEEDLYGVTYLPQPGDSDALLVQKQEARSRAVAAIEAGMPPAAIVAQELALRKSSQPRTLQPITASPGPTAAPVQIPEGIDQADWDLLTPEERELWR